VLIRNSPTISPPVKRNVSLNSRHQASRLLRWCDFSSPSHPGAGEPEPLPSDDAGSILRREQHFPHPFDAAQFFDKCQKLLARSVLRSSASGFYDQPAGLLIPAEQTGYLLESSP
jgi:hypothetical protein